MSISDPANNDAMYEQSITWIAAHPNATTSDLPGHLLEFWLRANDNGLKLRDGSPFLLKLFFDSFSKVYLEDMARRGEKISETVVIKKELVAERFQNWVILLTVVVLHRKGRLGMKPMSLFTAEKDPAMSIQLFN
jgi:hypothetical protein